MLALLIGPLITSGLNNDPVTSGSVLLPGVGTYDGLAAIFGEFVFILPFFLGRQFLRSSADFEDTFRALVIGGLVYSLPMLFEIRMSPRLHRWLYGFSPSGFTTLMRYGGFRPSVFMDNSLVAAFFIMTTTIAAAAFWRAKTRIRKLDPVAVTGYLSVVLILCKSLGALVYGALALPFVRFAKPRLQIRIATILAVLAVSYPILRAEESCPHGYFHRCR